MTGTKGPKRSLAARALAGALALALVFDAALPAAAAAAEAFRSIEGITVDADSVRIETDAPVQYRAFFAQEPPRLVVDLYDAQFRSDEKNLKGSGRFLKGVRGGQHSSSPRKVSRVVLDLAELAGYQVASLPNGLRIMLTDGAQGAAKAAAPMKDAPAQAAPEAEVEEAAAEGDEEAMPMLEGKKAPGEVQTEVRVGAAKASTGARRPRARREIMTTLPKEKINLDFEGTDVRDVLKLMGVRAGVNLIYGGDVSGTVTVHLKQVPFDEAFRTVLSMANLTTQQVGENILRVMTPGSLKTERGAALPTTRVFPLNYTKADEIKQQIDSVRSAEGRAGSTVVAKATNSLIVTDTQEGMIQIEQLISQLDQRPKQVLIEAKLIEVQHSKGFDLGVQWDYQAIQSGTGGRWFTGMTGNPLATPPGGATATTPRPASGGPPNTGVGLPAASVFGALTLGRITDRSFLTATLTAAATQGKARILSDPRVATLNNQQATINITRQIPYVTTNITTTGSTTNFAYTSVGITLDVLPTINADGRITLKVKPTVSQQAATIIFPGAGQAPAVDTRNADTTVLVRDGETIVIGGLVSDTEREDVSKIPFFGDLPLLGFLFRSKSVTRDRTELLVFVTPRILPD